MENIQVSIIVPIYNVEQYLRKCVESLTKQDHKNIEIILVDDGSPDRSGEIADQLAQKDSRIQVIHKENGGVSSARNAGLDIAAGEYVMFVDGDDYVDSDYVSYFLQLVIKNGCEIGMNESNYTYKNTKNTTNDTPGTIDSLKAIEYIYTAKIFVAVWNKIYNRSFLQKHNIHFDTDFWYGEGMLFNILCLQYVDSVALGSKNVYHQVFNTESAMRAFNLKSNHCGIRSLEKQKELFIKKNRAIENAWNYHYLCFSITILAGLIKSNMTQSHKEEYLKCRKNLFLNFIPPLLVSIGAKRKVIHILYALFPVTMARRSAKKDLALAKLYKSQKN